MTKWHDSHDDLLSFLHWLVYELEFSARQLLSVVEKPWHWDKEYRLYQLSEQSGPWLAECPQCGKEHNIKDASEIGWQDGSTSALCGKYQGQDEKSEDFCDDYLEILI